VNRTPVWITGVGAVTPVGHSYEAVADNLLAGRSGVRPVEHFPVADHSSRMAGWIDAVPCPPGWDAEVFACLSRHEQALLWCCITALHDAGWWERRGDVRVGLVLGVGAEWLVGWETDRMRGGTRVRDPQQETESLVHTVCRKLQVSGPAVSLSAACAGSNYALEQGRRWLELGWVDMCLAGACEMAVTSMGLAGFGNLRALSQRNDAPAAASRPFDRGRDGFVLAEGGAMFVLEPAARARRRSARVYGEVAGCGSSSDAFHMVMPSSDPEPSVAAMRQALADAGVTPAEVDYVNAHATSTPVGDAAEARVLRQVFSDGAATLPVSSTKSMTGHLLTAASAVEALACLVALQRRAVPPTINLDDPDPECALCHVAHEARPHPVRVAVSNAFGFGGSNTCLVLKAV
jgi:3-oxoacyl-[acyl-carrier-protein] synthase II